MTGALPGSAGALLRVRPVPPVAERAGGVCAEHGGAAARDTVSSREVSSTTARGEPAQLGLSQGVQAGAVERAGGVEFVADLAVISQLTAHTAGGGAASWARGRPHPALTPPAAGQQQQQQQQHGEPGESHLRLGLTNTGLLSRLSR